MTDLTAARTFNARRSTMVAALAFLAWLPVARDADAGSLEVAQAIQREQVLLGLEADGKLGPVTVDALRRRARPQAPTVPHGRAGVDALCGDPGFTDGEGGRLHTSPAWRAEHLVHVTLHTGQAITVHRVIAGELLEAYRQACLASGYTPHCDGCFVPRRKNWSLRANPSTHSWAIAVDWNASKNGRGRTNTELRQHLAFVAVFEAFGFTWGGRWSTPDDMHFQFATGI